MKFASFNPDCRAFAQKEQTEFDKMLQAAGEKP